MVLNFLGGAAVSLLSVWFGFWIADRRAVKERTENDRAIVQAMAQLMADMQARVPRAPEQQGEKVNLPAFYTEEIMKRREWIMQYASVKTALWINAVCENFSPKLVAEKIFRRYHRAPIVKDVDEMFREMIKMLFKFDMRLKKRRH